MKKSVLIVLLLTGCTETTAIDSAIKSIYSQVDAIEQSLSADCMTDVAKSNLGALKEQIQTIEKTCNVYIDNEKQKAIKWEIAFFSMLIIMLVWFLRKIVL